MGKRTQKISPQRAHLRAVIGNATLSGNIGKADAARQELKVLSAEEYIRRAVESWPPLTAEQRDRLAVILHGAPDGGGRDAT